MVMKINLQFMPQKANLIVCKIDSHIPTDDGLACLCGYFVKDEVSNDINIKDGFYDPKKD
jgi:hypothetical protein